jgi:hypothetical protein
MSTSTRRLPVRKVMRAAMDRWERYVDDILTGEPAT